MSSRRLLALAAAALALGAPAGASARITGPAGVGVSTVARGIPFPTNVVFDPAGGLWATSGAGGPLTSDGVYYLPRGARHPRHVARGLHTALGLRWYGGRLYVASVRSPSRGQVVALSGFDGRRFAHRRTILAGLPVGRHTVDSIVTGPGDGRLYLGVGSVYDNHGRDGRVVSFRPSGRGLRVEARGLRNPYGLAFVPGTDQLLITDNGRDDLGPFRPPDELDAQPVGAAPRHFGFPRCPARCTGPVAPFAPHSSADGLAVTADWAGAGLTAFVAQNGSSFASNPTGNAVVRVSLRGPPRVTRFARGFAKHDPLGAAIGPDGALYVTLFLSGAIVRFGEPPGS